MTKPLVIILLAVTLIFLFTGCTSDEIKLYKITESQKAVSSMDTEASIRLSITAGNASDSLKAALAPLSDMKIGISGTVNQDSDKGLLKLQAVETVGSGDMSFKIGCWLNLEQNFENPSFNEIIRLPYLMRADLPEPMKDKEYIVYDIDRLMTLNDDESLQYNNNLRYSMLSNLILSKKIERFYKQYIKACSPGFEVIKAHEATTAAGEKQTVYTLSLNDKSFKALLKYLLNDLSKNEAALDLLKDIMISIPELARAYDPNTTNEELSIAKQQMRQAFYQLKEMLPELINGANKTLDAFDNIRLIGQEGIEFKFTVNQKGFIISQEGKMDLVLDTGAIQNAFGLAVESEPTASSEPMPTYKIKIDFTQKNTAINNAPTVEFPKLNDNNSVKISDIRKKSLQPRQSANIIPVNVVLDGEKLNLDPSPRLINGRVLVPVRDIFEALGAKVSWEPTTKTVTATRDDKTVKLRPLDMVARVNDEEAILDVPAFIIQNKTFVPLRFVSEALDAGIVWDDTTKTAYIMPK